MQLLSHCRRHINETFGHVFAVEWATVIFFAAAGVIGLVRAVKGRRVFDGLVALFCLFFAGEEMSWSQRLLGFTPPAYFLEHNTQQELNLHNFGFLFGRPRVRSRSC